MILIFGIYNSSYFYIFRDSNSTSQRYANLPSMLLKLRSKKFQESGTKILKTHEKYLPPLATKITDPNTIKAYMEYFQNLSKYYIYRNTTFVNITLDIGAAMNAYKFLWGNLEQYSMLSFTSVAFTT